MAESDSAPGSGNRRGQGSAPGYGDRITVNVEAVVGLPVTDPKCRVFIVESEAIAPPSAGMSLRRTGLEWAPSAEVKLASRVLNPSGELDLVLLVNRPGHWARDYPQKSQPRIRGSTMFCSSGSPRAYVNAEFHGRPLRCMLDTGCDRSVIGKKLLENEPLTSARFTLTAAGKTPLQVDGDTHIEFTIEGHQVGADVSVSPQLDELLLGCDWLTCQSGKWDFRTRYLPCRRHRATPAAQAHRGQMPPSHRVGTVCGAAVARNERTYSARRRQCPPVVGGRGR